MKKFKESVYLYVEGGGKGKDLPINARQGFQKFIAAAGISHKPKVVYCGPRRRAYDHYCRAIANGEQALLLVDSEAQIHAFHQQPADKPEQWKPWAHLQNRDQWPQPPGSKDEDCHLMVQMMEHWFLADREALKNYFKQGFSEAALPAIENPLESLPKEPVIAALEKASKASGKGSYEKGRDSFELLGQISPAKVAQASPWAKRFINTLIKKMA